MQTAHYPEVSDDFGNWLAGFADGEGSFSIFPQNRTHTFVCRFQLKLRRDDRAILEEIIRTTGLGHLVDIRARLPPKGLGSKPMVDWRVGRQAECLKLVGLFDRCPLRAKKAKDFTVWRRAVHLWIQSTGSGGASVGRNQHVWHGMSLLRRELQAGRRYDGMAEIVVPGEDPRLF